MRSNQLANQLHIQTISTPAHDRLTFLGMNNNAKLGIYPLKKLPHNHNPVTDISLLSINFMILRNRDKAW